MHWIGVMYHQGLGVPKNVEKAVEHLKKSAKAGNCYSQFKLFLIYSQEETLKDVKLAYKYLQKAMLNGFTAFDDFSKYFKENYDILVTDFIA